MPPWLNRPVSRKVVSDLLREKGPLAANRDGSQGSGVTALSEANGNAKAPWATAIPARRANLRVVNSSEATSQITVGGTPVTVQNLSVDAPVSASPGGGLTRR